MMPGDMSCLKVGLKTRLSLARLRGGMGAKDWMPFKWRCPISDQNPGPKTMQLKDTALNSEARHCQQGLSSSFSHPRIIRQTRLMTWAELKTDPKAGCLCQFKSHTFGKQQVFLLSLVHKGNPLILEETTDLSPSCWLWWLGLARACAASSRTGHRVNRDRTFNGRGWTREAGIPLGRKALLGQCLKPEACGGPGPAAMTTVWTARILCVSTATLCNPNASPHPHTVLQQPKENTVIRDPEVLDCQLQTKGSICLLILHEDPPTLTPLPSISGAGDALQRCIENKDNMHSSSTQRPRRTKTAL